MENKNGSLPSVTGSKNVLYTDSVNIKFNEGSWWERRSSLEKKLIVLFVIVLLLAIGLLVGLLVVQNQKSKEKPEHTTPSAPIQPETCTTPGCVAAAARILDTGDFSVNPCEDFYEYACGSWLKKNIISEERSGNNIFWILDDVLNIKLKSLIEASPTDSGPNSVTKAKDLYQSCLNMDTLDTRGSTPLLDTLSQFGGWPVLNPAWDESSFRLETMLTQLSAYNMVPLIYMGVSVDLGNSSIYRIYFDQPGLGMGSRNYFLKERNDTSLMAYQTFIKDSAIALGADPARAEMDAEEIVDFEIELANITVPLTDRSDQNKLYNLRTITEMAQNYSSFDWLGYTQAAMSIDGVGIDIDADEVVVNWSPPYFEKLFPLLDNTPKRVQANYMVWRYVQQRVKLLGSTFQDIILEYDKVLTGKTAVPPRWKICLGYVNSVMSMAVARMYADTHFDEKAKSATLELISYLRGAFNELLAEADWMDDATRLLAKEKAAVMKEKIGYPDAIKNNTYLDDLYKLYNMSRDMYFENVNLIHQLAARRSLRRLRGMVDRSRWLVPPAIVNAFYYRSWNEIVFPMGILQPPFYSETQPWSLNFGGIGSVIGHEITHGFDSGGRQRDKNGNLNQWWADDVIERFNIETQCFVNQTSSFFMPEAQMYVNGEQTKTEDVADSGGMKQSFRAYRQWVANQGKEEPLLPGISLNNNQLFFLNWAQNWCTLVRPATAVFYIYSGYHSPGRLRAFAPMLNTPEFAEAYNCPSGSPMNPKKKCSVW